MRVEDLVRLLRTSEEYGRQHIFLYKCQPKRATELMDQQWVRKGLAARGATSVLGQPILVDWPDAVRIVDARWENHQKHQRFVLKIVEPRVRRVFVDEVQEGEFFLKRYADEKTRAINLFELRSDGFLQLRIQKHRNDSNYENDIKAMWRIAETILPPSAFGRVSLARTKAAIWDKKAELAGEISFSDSRLRNNFGTILTATISSEASSLSEDQGAAISLDDFLREGGICESLNTRFLGRSDGASKGLSDNVRVVFPPGVNEFVVTAQCTMDDYERVLAKIAQLNQ